MNYFFQRIVNNIYCSLFKRGKLPDFIIIGSQKAGSTYLQHILSCNPEIEMSPNFPNIIKDKNALSLREIHFFNSDKFKKGAGWYKLFFNNNKKLQGEKTPIYISQIVSHKRMFETVPNAKLILLIREPAARLYSAYNQPGAGYDRTKSFEENIELDLAKNSKDSLVARGFYIDQIENLLRYYPKNQLLIIITEQMKKDPEKIYRKVCDFLDIGYSDVDFNKKVNANKYKDEINKETEEKLRNLYKPYNQRLYNFLGQEIEEWEKKESN